VVSFRDFDFHQHGLTPGLIVDLGTDIGSKAWWRGVATLVGMLALCFWLAMSPVKLPAHAGLPPAPEQLALVSAVSLSPLDEGGVTGQRVGATALAAPLGEAPERPRIQLVAKLKEIDSFSGALSRAGVGGSDRRDAAAAISNHIDIARLLPGTEFDVTLGRRPERDEPRPLESLAFRANFETRVELSRGEDGAIKARAIPIEIRNEPLRISGYVGDSLYKSARAEGLSSRVVANFIRAMSPKVNFQRSVYASDSYDVIVEHKVAETGETRTGDLLYARINGNGKDIEIALWEKDGQAHYFLPDGRSVKEGLSAHPVRGARLSSGYGMRRHPILKRMRMHAGVDYAARRGTPIEATAPGKVVFAARNGGYGKQVRIQHKNGIVTSYSHMNSFSVTRGSWVSQGQTIGTVGSTGMSTGPHLHYEVHVNGKRVNPRSQKLPTGLELEGEELAAFQRELDRLRKIAPKTAPAGPNAPTDA
jgi:murein DD-endopeptidase MepM/ murein hydrolase activator NlpD